MKAIVKYHEDCKEDMLEWIEGMLGQETYRSLFLDVYIENLTKCLRESGGRDAALIKLGAVRIPRIEPPFYTWRYTDDLLVHFAVRAQTRPSLALSKWLPGWLTNLSTRTSREIIVLRLVS